MSDDVKGGLNYALLKRHYDNDDYVALVFVGPFAGVEQAYVVGTMAYLADTTLPTTKLGWTLYTPMAPLPLVYQALGVLQGPAFEAKDILFYATVDCLVRFEGSNRVQHLITANTYIRFHRRCFVFYATQAGGTLRVWMEG